MDSVNVALVGATGFIGKQILIDLINNGYNVTVVLHKTENKTLVKSVRTISLRSLMSSRNKYDYIINCAGYYTKSTNILEIHKIRQGNFVLIKKLIRFQKQNGGSLITFGSYFEHKPLWQKTQAINYVRFKIKARKILNLSAQKNSFPIFYIYLFDTYGEEDNRNKVLTFIIEKFKEGKIPKLTGSNEIINWSHKSDISESVIDLVRNSEKYSANKLHEFQIRSSDEFKLIDFVNIINKSLEFGETGITEILLTSELFDCAPNLEFFKPKHNVIDFTLTSIRNN